MEIVLEASSQSQTPTRAELRPQHFTSLRSAVFFAVLDSYYCTRGRLGTYISRFVTFSIWTLEIGKKGLLLVDIHYKYM